MEVLCDELVPEGNVSLAVVNDGAQFGLILQLLLESVHALNTVDEVDHAFLVVLLVESEDDIFKTLDELFRPNSSSKPICQFIPATNVYYGCVSYLCLIAPQVSSKRRLSLSSRPCKLCLELEIHYHKLRGYSANYIFLI